MEDRWQGRRQQSADEVLIIWLLTRMETISRNLVFRILSIFTLPQVVMVRFVDASIEIVRLFPMAE
jgi:hypothetical protein